MRVLCINSDFSNLTTEERKRIKYFPAEMEEYIIEEQIVHNGKLGYRLVELPKNHPCVFKADRFIVFEDQDEWHYEEEEMQEGGFYD